MSKLDNHRRAIAEVLAILASRGLAGTLLRPEDVGEATTGELELGAEEFTDLVRWLESEGLVRVPNRPNMAGWFPKVQLTALGLQILGLESPLSKGQSIEQALSEPPSGDTRTKIGEFIGSILGSGLGSLINSQK